jgi:hypothetical protein
MNITCGTYGRGTRISYKFWSGNLQARYHLEGIDVGKVMLKLSCRIYTVVIGLFY